jgi:hypothetical protein
MTHPQPAQTHRLGVLEGDGIGREIVPASVAVVDAALAPTDSTVEWVALPVGWKGIEKYGDPTPRSTIDALSALDGWLLGPHDSATYPEPHRSQLNPSGTLRKHFDLFANIRPAKGYPGAKAVSPDADLVIVRENTEGFYADRNTYAGTGEFMPSPLPLPWESLLDMESSGLPGSRMSLRADAASDSPSCTKPTCFGSLLDSFAMCAGKSPPSSPTSPLTTTTSMR